MRTSTVIQDAPFTFAKPTPGGPAGGTVELVFNAWEPASVDLLFHYLYEGGKETTQWMFSREALAYVTSSPRAAHTYGDLQAWWDTDGENILIRIASHEGTSVVRIPAVECVAFVAEVERVCPQDGVAYTEAMAVLVDETIAGSLQS